MGMTGAILSGGMSRRMGVPKAGLLLPDGRSMIETVRDTLAGICDEVVLLGGSFGLEGHRVIEDERADSGPLAGIEALLASQIDDRYLIVPCDMPGFDRAAAGMLLAERDARSAHFEGHPLPCVVGSSLREGLTAALDSGLRAVRDWHAQAGASSIKLGETELDDADTPEAFESMWRSRLSTSR